ncbi:MAG: DNA translocase FtsK, partial [Candidatus Margulisiibacteriota bacterium]
LSDDIALNLAAKGVRIEAPIPGKSVVGIEIPNHTTHMVSMLPLARDERFLYSSSPLFIALGKDLDGKTLYSDLSKMPHLLVAGATGSGKSVCINSIVISLILRNTPSTVRFIMIDPKRVELSVYDDIPHLIAPVVTDPKKAAVTLRWCVREMEKRYEELARLGVRNIQSYNEKIEEMIARRETMPEEEKSQFFIPQKHSFIVVIIDELADMMLAAPAEVETSIARISQMARAVGIHLVVATQRPSVDVITGLIKANVPSRIAFAVSSQIDSRTILDGMGAEKLLGKGDMLYKPVGSMQPIRVQGVFISDQEVHSIVAHVKAQGKPEYLQEVVNLKPEDLEDLKSSSSGEHDEGEDEFFSEARDIVLQTRIASISYIQRKLRIGYNRAARIMEQLEEAGIVSAPDGDGKNRKVNG